MRWFLIEDAGDGWWHCPSPLRCEVIDGPAPAFDRPQEARYPETYWLVETDTPIEWHGEPEYAARWGSDHPLCSPMAPTRYALVMAGSRWNGPVRPPRGAGIPAYPVPGNPRRVADADPVRGLGIKVGLRTIPTDE